jgi:HK97 family phage major capsid protein
MNHLRFEKRDDGNDDNQGRRPPIKPEGDNAQGDGGAAGNQRANSSVSLPNASKKEFRSFGEFLGCVIQAGSPNPIMDPRLLERRATGLNEMIGSEGGFLVGPEWTKEILARSYEMGAILSRVDRHMIGQDSNGLTVNAIDETSRVTGSRWGGIQSYWLGESNQGTATKPKFREMELKLKKLMGLCYLTDELLADSVAMESVVRKGFAEEIMFMCEDAIINGNGAGMPLGIMSGACLIAVTATRTAGHFTYSDAVKMLARMWARSRPNAVWLINQDVEVDLLKMTMPGDVTSGALVPVYLPAGGASQLPYAQLFGRPVIPVEYCQTMGTAGDVIFADFSQYVFIDKGSPETASSIHLRFDYGETALRFVFRCDGQPKWNAALTPFKGSSTVSPFIVTATA